MARINLGIFLSSFFSGEGASLSPTSIGRAAPGTDATIGTMQIPAHHANGCFFSYPKGLGTNTTMMPVYANAKAQNSEYLPSTHSGE